MCLELSIRSYVCLMCMSKIIPVLLQSLIVHDSWCNVKVPLKVPPMDWYPFVFFVNLPFYVVFYVTIDLR
jgi:hypothetical protein